MNYQLFGFLISFENFFILLIILGYGNDKLRDCALTISHLRRHPYVLLPIIIIIITLNKLFFFLFKKSFKKN